MSLSKSAVRSRLIAQRAAITEAQQVVSAQHVYEQLLTHGLLTDRAHVATYWPVRGELDPRPIMRALDEAGTALYLPRVNQLPSREMSFYRYQFGEVMMPNVFKVPEPVADLQQLIQPDALDMILLPLVAFDHVCNRVGMGSGYYDSTLNALRTQSARPLLVGLAYEFQRVDGVEIDEWDVPLDYIVTETTVLGVKTND